MFNVGFNAFQNAKERPKIKIGLTIFDLVIEIAGLAALVSMWIFLLSAYFKLPEIIPTHYNFSGEADVFGGKSEIWFLPAIATIVFIATTILSFYPHIFNYPVKITEENALRQYKNAVMMLRCLKLLIVVQFELIVIQTIRIADGRVFTLGWLQLLPVLIMLVLLSFYVIKSFIYK